MAKVGMRILTLKPSITIRLCRRTLAETFLSGGILEPHASAEYIVAHAIDRKTLNGVDQSGLLNSQKLSKVIKLAQKRLNNMPLQYVLEEWDFRDMTIFLRPPVFIPRPETENLVTSALSDPNVLGAKKFLEVGCGSGAICISLLKCLPLAKCVAIDRSHDACELTQLNAQKQNVGSRLTVLQDTWNSDFISRLKKVDTDFDFLISNPPYISDEDLPTLQPEIIRFEDHGALFGGVDGLDTVREILTGAPHVVRRKGSIWLEVGLSHPETIQKMTSDSLLLKYVASHNDFTQRLRFCHLEIFG